MPAFVHTNGFRYSHYVEQVMYSSGLYTVILLFGPFIELCTNYCSGHNLVFWLVIAALAVPA